MKSNNEIIDGLSVTTWKEIEKISRNYPKPIRFAEGAMAKIAMLKFYYEPILKDGKPPMEAMDQGRMLTIAFKMYINSEGDEIKKHAMNIINKIIN